MIGDEFGRAIQSQVGADPLSPLSLRQLCAACGEVTALRASIVLMGERNRQAASGASEGATEVEELQFTLGEGPGVDAYADGRPVLVEDLTTMSDRWTQFVPAAQLLGVGAVFAFPLQVGAIRTGVLSLYSESVHLLSGEKGLELLILADLVTEAVLAMQSGAGPEELARTLSEATEHPSIVHQATGMVAMQLDCPVQDALSRLRGRAFLDGVGLEQLARRVVDRAVRFEP